ncbi:MAG: hypothetical protein HOO96_15655, partial [Polyangiaceae bacterium]|nr:hypothetical protein [Polyangiaceae bacterium]
VVRESGETFQVENLFVADGSVLPTSLGVNSQLPIMTIALKIGRGIAQGAAAALREAHAQPPTARTTSATWANTNPLARHTSA